MRGQRANWLNADELALSVNERLLLASLPHLVDDEGRAPVNPALLKSRVFLHEQEVGVSEIELMLLRLDECGHIVVYGAGDRELMQVTDWPAVDHGKPSEWPPPSRAPHSTARPNRPSRPRSPSMAPSSSSSSSVRPSDRSPDAVPEPPPPASPAPPARDRAAPGDGPRPVRRMSKLERARRARRARVRFEDPDDYAGVDGFPRLETGSPSGHPRHELPREPLEAPRSESDRPGQRLEALSGDPRQHSRGPGGPSRAPAGALGGTLPDGFRETFATVERERERESERAGERGRETPPQPPAPVMARPSPFCPAHYPLGSHGVPCIGCQDARLALQLFLHESRTGVIPGTARPAAHPARPDPDRLALWDESIPAADDDTTF